MIVFIVFSVIVATVSATNINKVLETKVSYESEQLPQPAYGESQLYQGQYQGKCGNDGFYYNDESSIVICSNSNAYIQPCAPGSKNSAKDNYQHGSSYGYRDFCDINLVDDGYTLNYGYNNDGYHKNQGYDIYEKEVPQYSDESKEYNGQYQGKCDNDGFYYNDDASFVICSNGNAYIQPCAPGSKNSAHYNYQQGNSYYYHDFCDINLVDEGYTLEHGYSNEGHTSYGISHHRKEQLNYPEPAPRYSY